MGIVLALRKVSDNQLEALHKTPKQIKRFLTGVEADPSFSQKIASLFGKRSSQDWAEPSEDDVADLDKAWQGIHFLLTGTASEGNGPASYLLTGRTIGDVDVVGYGSAMSLSSKEVADFNAYLRAADEDALKQRYDPTRMTELDIYPAIWEEDAGALEYLLAYFKALKAFVLSAAKEKQALIIYLT